MKNSSLLFTEKSRNCDMVHLSTFSAVLTVGLDCSVD